MQFEKAVHKILAFPYKPEMTKKIGRPSGVGKASTVKKPSDNDNAKVFREEIIGYNDQPGYRMRHCTNCGVGIRLMTYIAYEDRYGDGPCLCERCEKMVAEKRKPFKKKDKFVSGHGTGLRFKRDGTEEWDSLTLVGG